LFVVRESLRPLFEVSAAPDYHKGTRAAIAMGVAALCGIQWGQVGMGVFAGLAAFYVILIDPGQGSPGRLWFLLRSAATNCAVVMMAAFLSPQPGWFRIATTFLVAMVGGLASARRGGMGGASGPGIITIILYCIFLGLGQAVGTPLQLLTTFALGSLWGLSIVGVSSMLGFDVAGSAPEPAEPLRESLRWRSPQLRHALRMALCIALGMTLYFMLDIQRGYWIALTIAIVLKPDLKSSVERVGMRLMGTLAGCLASAPILMYVHQHAWLLLFLVVFMFWGVAMVKAQYAVASFAFTGMALEILHLAHVTTWHIALLRMGDTMVGGVLALGVGWLLRSRQPGVEPARFVPAPAPTPAT
jgi:hypothetical protein